MCGPVCRESEKDGADAYFELMEARFGKWGGRAVAVAQASPQAA